jgi:glycosyltransferase involved in cell wall biosynthesis/VanZ family protein
MNTMKRTARLFLLVLLGAGLWLALKPTIGGPRLTFLPQRLSEQVDNLDFLLNMGAFAILGLTVWLAFGVLRQVLPRFCVMAGVITLLNITLEIAQTRIPGRLMDMEDLRAGLIGCVLGLACGVFWEVRRTRRKSGNAAPQVLFLDQTGRLGGAELMLLDIAAARAADSEVALFQDGEFRSALEKAGVKTRVFTLSDEAAAVDKQAGWRSVLGIIPAVVDLVLQIAQASRSFDVVYANTAKALIARLAGRRLIFHLHDIISDGHFSRLNQRALIGCANACASSVIANSEATRAAFISSGGRSSLCVVVPNGFHIPEERTPAKAVHALRTELQIPQDAWTVLMAGRLAPWKGQHVLLEALRSVPGAHAVLLGDALFTEEDRRYAQQLHATAEEPALAGRIHFAGFKTHTMPYFDLADAIVHASVHAEPFGRVIVEGMLAGKPVIATRAGGAAEILQHEHTGLLVAPGDAADLAASLLRLQKDAALASAIAHQAQRTARSVYALSTVQEKIESVIRQTARLKPAPEAVEATKTPIHQVA